MDRAFTELLRCPRTGQPLDLTPTVEVRGRITYGVLSAEGFHYPIVHGIPMLQPGLDPIVDLIRQGKEREATARAALGDRNASRWLPLLDSLGDVRGVGRGASLATRVLQRRRLAAGVNRLFGHGSGDTIVGDPLELEFLSGRHPIQEGYLYFRYRFGTPRYLVSLALVDALPEPTDPVLDVGCGAGHLVWALTQRDGPGPVVGIDPSFAQLLVAAEMAPDAWLACADGRSLPLAEGTFDRVVSSDVLPYITDKASACRELQRVLSPAGTLIMTALRVTGRQHVHGGETLSPQAWEDLVSALPVRKVLSDDAILDRYLQGLGPGGAESDRSETATPQTISIVAGSVPTIIHDGPWATWPHIRGGELALHPLLSPAGTSVSGDVVERRFPSETYAIDNRRIVDYLPERCVISPPGAPSTDTADESVLEPLIAQVALLALPPAAR